MPKPIYDEAQRCQSAAIVGMGGGDFLLGLPIIKLLSSLGVKKFYLGSTCVQWWSKDGYIAIAPDIYSITKLSNAEVVPPAAAILNEKTTLHTDLFSGQPPEPKIARLIDAVPFVLSLEAGVEGLVESLNNLVDRLGADMLIAVDCGGDSILSGHEMLPPLTPLHDWTTIAALTRVNIPCFLALAGYACDGEVSLEELHRTIGEICGKGGLLGSYALSLNDASLLEKALNIHFDPVAAMVLKAARGEFGQYRILGFRIVTVTPLASLILFFDPKIVSERGLSSELHGTRTIADVEKKILSRGILPETKYMHYVKLFRNGVRD